MEIYRQFVIILLFSFIGEALSTLLSLPVPGSIIGMIFLFLALQFRLIHTRDVREVGGWLLGNMTILFLPAGVGIMAKFDAIKEVWWQLIVIILVTLAVNILVIGKVVQFIKVHFEGDYVDSVGRVSAEREREEKGEVE